MTASGAIVMTPVLETVLETVQGKVQGQHCWPGTVTELPACDSRTSAQQLSLDSWQDPQRRLLGGGTAKWILPDLPSRPEGRQR